MCQAFFKAPSKGGQQRSKIPVVGTCILEILQIPEHNHLASFSICPRLNIKQFLQRELSILVYSSLSDKGNQGSLHIELNMSVSCWMLQRLSSCL